MKRVGMPRSCRSVFKTAMRQQSMQQNQRTFRYLERDQLLFGPRLVVKNLKLHAAVSCSTPPRLQSTSMPTGNGPQAAILDRCIFEREPKAGDVDRLGIEKRAVLMTRDFTTNVRLFEDVHRLQQERNLKPESSCEFFYSSVA